MRLLLESVLYKELAVQKACQVKLTNPVVAGNN